MTKIILRYEPSVDTYACERAVRKVLEALNIPHTVKWEQDSDWVVGLVEVMTVTVQSDSASTSSH